jgi:hypothetical protein
MIKCLRNYDVEVEKRKKKSNARNRENSSKLTSVLYNLIPPWMDGIRYPTIKTKS